MKGRRLWWRTLAIVLFSTLLRGGDSSLLAENQASPDTTATSQVSTVVSVEAKHGKEVPTVYKEDVRVFQEKTRVPVKDWVPLQGDQGGLELYILIDDATDSSIGQQFDDIRKFINGQPVTAAIGVGYMHNGTVQIVQQPTTDHGLAAKALRLPLGSETVMASPYIAITDLIKRWPQSPARHEILAVTSGIDVLQPGTVDTYLDDCIEQAQKAGVQVYTIYAARTGHFGHSFWRLTLAQGHLSQLADETGGEGYFQGTETPVAFAPYLDQFADRLNHQYRLTFLAKPGKSGALQPIRLETEVRNAELVSADKVYIPAAK